jgi:hypothetical protein
MKPIHFAMSALLFLTACSKGSDSPAPEVPKPVVSHAISRIEKAGEVWTITYNADSTLNTVDRKFADGAPINTYVFIYAGGKLVEVKSAGKWKYYYTGEELTAIETYNNFGQLRYRNEFVYVNGKITERTGYLTTAATVNKPDEKTKYTYGADGKLAVKESFDYINNSWSKAGEVHIIKYDNYPNTAEHLENFPFIPKKFFPVNNVIREQYVNDIGQPYGLAVHEYQYDVSGRPVGRKSTFSYTGFPDTQAEAKFQY